MKNFKLIEGCCGSAALSFHLCDIKKPLLTYQGSKWKYRKDLAEIIESRGFKGKPDQIELYDPGPWSRIIPILKAYQKEVVEKIKEYQKSDPKEIYNQLHKKKIPEDPIEFTADFLFLQRLAFSGKAVGCSTGIFLSPGFNKTSAYGKIGEKFGEIKPMIPSLIKTLETINLGQLPDIQFGKYLGSPSDNEENTVVYLDPPYRKSTKYPDGHLSREDLVKKALEWSAAGALVLVSEAEIIEELNWESICISGKKDIENPFKSKKEEYVMINRGERE